MHRNFSSTVSAKCQLTDGMDGPTRFPNDQLKETNMKLAPDGSAKLGPGAKLDIHVSPLTSLENVFVDDVQLNNPKDITGFTLVAKTAEGTVVLEKVGSLSVQW